MQLRSLSDCTSFHASIVSIVVGGDADIALLSPSPFICSTAACDMGH